MQCVIFVQPSSVEKDATTGKMTIKFNARTEENGTASEGKISDADCVLFAVGRGPNTKNVGLDQLVSVLSI